MIATMRKKITFTRWLSLFVLIGLLALPNKSFSQRGQHVIDSMIAEIPKHMDSSLSKLFHDISQNYMSRNSDSGIEYGFKALSVAEKAGWEKGKADAYGVLGMHYHEKADFPASLSYVFKALKIYEEQKNTDGINVCTLFIGDIYFNTLNLEKALSYFNVALKRAEACNDPKLRSSCLTRIALIFKAKKEDSVAQVYFDRAIQVAKEYHLQSEENAALANMAMLFSEMKKYGAALEIHHKLLNYYTYGSTNWVVVYGSIGQAYLEVAKDSVYVNHGDRLIPVTRVAKADSAIRYLLRGVEGSIATGQLNNAYEFSKSLSEAYELRGGHQEALARYKTYILLRDSALSNDKRLGFAAQETKRETDLKEKQVQINKLALSEKRNERIIFIIGLALLALTVIVIYSYFSAQKKTNRLQRETLRQKEILMKEVHHRVKNNLQVVGTLLDLQLNTVSDEIARQAIKESASRLKAMSLIHQQLYQQEDITQIECANFATYLHTQLNAIFNKGGVEITWNNKMPLTMLDIDTAVPLGLIINELITNSYKYAFNSATGSIDISLIQEPGGYKLFRNYKVIG